MANVEFTSIATRVPCPLNLATSTKSAAQIATKQVTSTATPADIAMQHTILVTFGGFFTSLLVTGFPAEISAYIPSLFSVDMHAQHRIVIVRVFGSRCCLLVYYFI
jgi:hypothetical protein